MIFVQSLLCDCYFGDNYWCSKFLFFRIRKSHDVGRIDFQNVANWTENRQLFDDRPTSSKKQQKLVLH